MKELLRAIQTKNWAMYPPYAEGYYNVVDKLLSGELNEVLKEKDIIGKAQYLGASGFLFDEEVEDDEPEGNINVIPVKGVVVKYDTMCETGTQTMARMIEEGEKDDYVSFHLLDIDTGGGQVDGTAHLARTIRNANKPVIAYVNGLSASAGYWIASQADKVIINDQTTMVGSIGTMIRFADIKGALEAQGVKEIEIYADASVDKNKDIREALKGNEDPIKETLNQLNDEFIADVKKGRKGVSSNALTGKVFIGEDIIKMGLADQMGDLTSAIDLGFQLTKENMFTAEDKKEFFADMKDHLTGLFKSEKNDTILTEKEEKMAIEQLEAQIAEKNSVIEATQAEVVALQAELDAETKAKEEAVADNKALVNVLADYKTTLGEFKSELDAYKAKEKSPADLEVAVKAEEPKKSEGYEGMDRKPHNPFA